MPFSERKIISCHLVDLNFHAFIAKSISISLTPSAVDTNNVNAEEAKEIILVKKMQLGLDKVLKDDLSPATAQISYSSSGGNVVFVVKGGKVFGTVSEGGNTFSLEPCYAQKSCHLWVKYNKKAEKNEIKI